MLDIALHTGGEHPDLWWVLVPSFVSFLAGIGIGTFSERVRGWLSPGHEPSND